MIEFVVDTSDPASYELGVGSRVAWRPGGIWHLKRRLKDSPELVTEVIRWPKTVPTIRITFAERKLANRKADVLEVASVTDVRLVEPETDSILPWPLSS